MNLNTFSFSPLDSDPISIIDFLSKFNFQSDRIVVKKLEGREVFKIEKKPNWW